MLTNQEILPNQLRLSNFVCSSLENSPSTQANSQNVLNAANLSEASVKVTDLSEVTFCKTNIWNVKFDSIPDGIKYDSGC